MIGAIAGDIIGSVYEWQNIKTKQFDLFRPDCFFTDDTVLTVALAESILMQTDYASLMKDYYRCYPGAGYGGLFHQWAQAHDSEPYNSWGNGAAMRISAVGFAFNKLEEVLLRAAEYTAVTHNHTKGTRARKPPRPRSFLPGQEAPRRTSSNISRKTSTTIYRAVSTRFAQPTGSTSHAKGPFLRRLCASWKQRLSKTQSETRYRLEETATR